MWGTPKSSPLAPIPTGGVSSPYSTVEVVPPSRHRSDSPPPCLPRAETHHSRCLPRVQAPLATSAAGYRFTSTVVPQETPATAPEQLPAPRPGLSLDSSRSVVIATPGPPPSGAHQAQATPVPSPRSGGPPSSRPRVKSAGRVGSRAPPLPCRAGARPPSSALQEGAASAPRQPLAAQSALPHRCGPPGLEGGGGGEDRAHLVGEKGRRN